MRLPLRQFLIAASAAASLACPATAQQTDDFSPPPDYYAPAEGLTETELRSAVHEIIDDHNALDYYNTLPVLWTETEADPDNSRNFILLYSGFSSSSWNREHVWPQSFGAGDGNAFSDAHHIYPTTPSVNSARSNFIFDEVTNGQPVPQAPGSFFDETRRIFEPRDEDKGRVARAMLYMDLRYEQGDPEGNLRLSDFANSRYLRMARLSTLLQWNRQFPPDDREIYRNHVIHNGFIHQNRLVRQGNRNPFTDFPELGDALHTADDFLSWGSWSIQHFTFTELSASKITGPLHNPDGDNLSNLIECYFGMDPRDAAAPESDLIAVDGAKRTLQFTRLKNPQASFISETLQFTNADNPSSDQWQTIPLQDSPAVTIADRDLMEQVTVSLDHLELDIESSAFRLLIQHTAPHSNPVSQTYAVYPDGLEPPLSPFADIPAYLATAWKQSPWFGMVHTANFPDVFHRKHHWLTFHGNPQDSDGHFIHDASLGWWWTSEDLYPLLYRAQSRQWLLFQTDTSAPHRRFLDLATRKTLSESDLNAN